MSGSGQDLQKAFRDTSMAFRAGDKSKEIFYKLDEVIKTLAAFPLERRLSFFYNNAVALSDLLHFLGKVESVNQSLGDESKKGLLLCVESALPNLEARNLSKCLRGLAKVGVSWGEIDGRFKENLLELIEKKLPIFMAQEIAGSIWALAKMGVSWEQLSGPLEKALIGCIQKNLPIFNAQDIGNSLHGLAKMGVSWEQLSGPFKKELLGCIQEKLPTFNEQNIANSLWALVCMEIPTAHFPRCSSLASCRFSEAEVQQLLQAKALGYALTDFQQARSAPQCAEKVSAFERSVLGILLKICPDGFRISSNPLLLGCMQPDILITEQATKKRWIIEVDGPHHFFSTGEITPETRLRNRIYKAKKLLFSVISYQEWDAAISPEEKKRVVLRHLAELGLIKDRADPDKDAMCVTALRSRAAVPIIVKAESTEKRMVDASSKNSVQPTGADLQAQRGGDAGFVRTSF